MAIRVLLLFVVILAVWVAVRRPAGRGPVAREWRDVLFVRVAAFVVGVVVASAAAQELNLGRGLMLAPAIVGLGVVAGVALGEAVVRPPRPPGPRTASLRPRRVRDYLPATLVAVVATVTAVHVATLATTTITAAADDMNRAGRVLAHECATMAQSRGPYPGSFYSVPLAAVLLLAGVIAAVALIVVARRPRGFAPHDIDDDVLRRRSMTTILAAGGAAVAASQAGIALFSGSALTGMDQCAAAWMRPTGIAMLATVPVAVVTLAWLVMRVMAPDVPAKVVADHAR